MPLLQTYNLRFHLLSSPSFLSTSKENGREERATGKWRRNKKTEQTAGDGGNFGNDSTFSSSLSLKTAEKQGKTAQGSWHGKGLGTPFTQISLREWKGEGKGEKGASPLCLCLYLSSHSHLSSHLFSSHLSPSGKWALYIKIDKFDGGGEDRSLSHVKKHISPVSL